MRGKGIATGLLVAFSLLFTSCSKEKLDLPKENDPVFTLTGDFNGDGLSLVAGDNGVYMHTGTEMINGVPYFKGSLSDGYTMVEMGIYDGYLDATIHDFLEEFAYFQNSPPFAVVPNQPLVVLSKGMFANSFLIDNIAWYKDNTFIGTNDAEIIEPGRYQIRADITFVDSSFISLENEIIVGYERHSNCFINFEIDLDYNIMAYPVDFSGVSGLQSITWYLNDSLIGTLPYLQCNLGQLDGIVKAVIDFGGIVREKSFYVNAQNTLKYVEDFTMFEEAASNNVEQDFNLKLVIKKNGAMFSSDLADNSNSTINITGIEYYGVNADNKEVYKLTAIISAKVRNMNGGNDIPVNFSTTFGVEIP